MIDHRALRNGAIIVAAALALAGCNASGRPPLTPPSGSSQGPATSDLGESGGAYTAQEGDTVYAVAKSFNVALRDLIQANRLTAPYELTPGQTLTIPPRRTHVVQAGDTVYGVSRQYGIDQSSLIRLNGLGSPYIIRVGQRLLLPASIEAASIPAAGDSDVIEQPVGPSSGGVTVEALPATRLDQAAAGVTESQADIDEAGGAPAQKPLALVEGAPEPASASGFSWPVNGKVVASFGDKSGGLRNDGINILAPRGSPVRAAGNGVVAYAGNELPGFGNLVLIRHGDGWMSAYAHNDKILVNRGDSVARGQTIGRVGSTGNVSEPQLHFELRRGTEAVDPIPHLGARGA
jgi:murein DD-endopeptidase MepM/ murein hydrolase activator NlpD